LVKILYNVHFDYVPSKIQEPLFHTFHCSQDHTVRVGLSWDQEEAASAFLRSVLAVLSRPENIGLSGPKSRRRGPATGRPVSWLLVADSGVEGKNGPRRPLSKADISSPVGFCHNVSLTIDNLPRHFSIPAPERSSLHLNER
jgi:hypothetical protein